MPKQNKKKKAPPAKSNRLISVSTYNQQGSGKVHQSVKKHDVVFMQETGALPSDYKRKPNGQIEGTIRRSPRLGGDLRIFGQEWGKKNLRCSLAIAIAEDLLGPSAKMHFIRSAKKGLRPALVVETRDAIFTSIHAPSSNHKFGAKIAAELLGKVRKQFPGKPVIAGGDMNTTPSLLKQNLGASGLQVASSGRATQKSGNSLDMFAFTPNSFSPTRVEASSSYQGSDHIQVSMTGLLPVTSDNSGN